MNKQEYERWEAPAPKKPKKGKWFLLGLLVLFVLYFVSGIKVSHHDSNEDKIEIEDQVSSDEVEDNEGFSFQSTLDNQEELNNKTDKVSQISDVAVKKADEVAEQAIEDANKAASQAIENDNKAVEEVLGTPYQTRKTETKKQKDNSELSTIEILERRNHARVVEQAKRAGVSTEGSDVEILERINHKHIVERAKREGVSTEGSDVEILERINRKHLERYK